MASAEFWHRMSTLGVVPLGQDLPAAARRAPEEDDMSEDQMSRAPTGAPPLTGRRLVQVYADDLEQATDRIRGALAGGDHAELQEALRMLTVDGNGAGAGGAVVAGSPGSEFERFLEPRDIASITHEANRRLCFVNGDKSQEEWHRAPEWQRDSAEKGVAFHLDHPEATPADSHTSWMAEKARAGWVWGPNKDPDASPPTHPCMVPYDQLPPEQQAKDYLFRSIVHGLAPFVMKAATA